MRLRQLQAALDAILKPSAQDKTARTKNPPPQKLFVPDIVRRITSENPQGLLVSQIFSKAKVLKPDLAKALLYATVSRLAKKGVLVHEGAKGSRHYKLSPEQEGDGSVKDKGSYVSP